MGIAALVVDSVLGGGEEGSALCELKGGTVVRSGLVVVPLGLARGA